LSGRRAESCANSTEWLPARLARCFLHSSLSGHQ
jgi:hypothetical protein